MIDGRRIAAQHYYDLLPTTEQQCGDIWSGINSNGLIGRSPTSGIVVTPACDLSQHKSETVTFLPIVSLRAYFSTLAALPEVKRAVTTAVNGAGGDIKIAWGDHIYRPPSMDSLQATGESVEARLAATKPGTKEEMVLNRVQAGLRILRAISAPDLTQIAASDLTSVFAHWTDIKARLVRNSHSSFLHFLPSDEQGAEFFGLRHHSLVMFRYPTTVPIEVLDLASGASDTTWKNVIQANIQAVAALENYREVLPIKMLRLKSEFLADLLSRYVTVYNRIGSPDFTDASIKRMCSEVDL